MAKKNPYIFTIGFNSSLPDHIRATEILNGSSEKAQLIADAILSYLGEKEETGASKINLSSIQPFVENLIQKEIQKALQDSRRAGTLEASISQEQVISLSKEPELPINEQLTKNITNAMSAFRKMK